jgi:hypothetical protein
MQQQPTPPKYKYDHPPCPHQFLAHQMLQMTVPSPVQQHGFSWEREILRIYGATDAEMATISYTAATDLPAAYNRLNQCDLSVKTTGSANTVCMGDALRIYDAAAESDKHMIVIHYRQSGTNKHVVSITEVDLSDARAALFGDLTRDDIAALDRAVKAIPHGRSPTAEEKAALQHQQRSLQARSGAIYLNIKCDSKAQRRLQCSFNRFQDFLTANPGRVVAHSDSNSFQGGVITAAIPSSVRVFKKKQPQQQIPSPPESDSTPH